MKTMTQRQQVLRHLQENGSITSWEAIMKFHATRLSGIIYSLRKGGYPIVSTMESTTRGIPCSRTRGKADEGGVHCARRA